MHRSLRSLALALVVVTAGAGCKTRLYELIYDHDAGVPDGGDLSDMSPDFAIADLTVIPDLTPPPDLVPYHYCNGIFVFDEENRFSFFDPVTLQYTDIVQRLTCPGAGTPFSMGVSHDGIAWVEYTGGNVLGSRLFRVDTATGACTPTKFVNAGGVFASFGMGFASDAPGSNAETLYIAGDGMTPRLGSIDLTNFQVNPIGALPGRAELTGTGAGELWAFFADVNPHVGRVDKMSGNVSPDTPLPQLGDLTNSAFAFGAFNGNFYAFIANGGATTSVYKFNPADGSLTMVLASSPGRHVVGAGVSTCAPTGLDR